MNPILKQKNYREVKIFDLTSGRFALFSEMIYFEDGFRLADTVQAGRAFKKAE